MSFGKASSVVLFKASDVLFQKNRERKERKRKKTYNILCLWHIKTKNLYKSHKKTLQTSVIAIQLTKTIKYS